MRHALSSALADQHLLDKIKEITRDHLLAIISEVRELSLKLDTMGLREQLLEDVTAAFHPDRDAGDMLVNGFWEAKRRADERVDECEAEELTQRFQYSRAE